MKIVGPLLDWFMNSWTGAPDYTYKETIIFEVIVMEIKIINLNFMRNDVVI